MSKIDFGFRRKCMNGFSCNILFSNILRSDGFLNLNFISCPGCGIFLAGQVIIISTVSSGILSDFAANLRRINVMLTRAKSLLIIIGNAETLQNSKIRSRVDVVHSLAQYHTICANIFIIYIQPHKPIDLRT